MIKVSTPTLTAPTDCAEHRSKFKLNKTRVNIVLTLHASLNGRWLLLREQV